MILKFKKKDFLSALRQGAMLAGVNATLPILDNIRMVSDGEEYVRIISSSLDVTVERKCKSEEQIDDAFDVCIPAKDLVGAVSRLSDYVFSIEIEEDNVRVVYGSGNITMPRIPSYEWPNTLPDNEACDAKFAIGTSNMAYIINTCNGFLGTDELRPQMMCVNMHVADGCVEYCATDAHRLVCESLDCSIAAGVSADFMIPKRTMPILRSLCEEADRPTDVEVLDRTVRFSCEDWSVHYTKPEGKYPNYKAITSQTQENDKKFTVNKSNFAGAVTRMLSAANANTSAIRFECGLQSVEMFSEDADFGKTAKETVEARSNNCEPITFGLNGVFLKTCVDIADAENVVISANSPNRAVTISDEKHPSKTILIMPIMLNS